MKSSICSLVLICIFSSCQFQEKQTFDILITHAAIVDVKSGKIIPEQLIGISDDTIRLVADINQEANYTGKTIIDAKGKYVLPGLWDNHVHFRGGDSLISENRDMLPLFLKYGVTAVRDAGGDITPSVLQWQKEIAEGKLAGPSIFTSGPKLDGDQPAWPGSIMVTDSADVKAALDSLEVLGVDYVKMYDGNLTKEMFYSIIKAAEERGLKTTGHMPLSANILEAAELGLDGSEHLYYVLKACSPKEDSLTQLNMGYGMMSEILQTYDTDLAKQVFNQLAKENVYITPTLYIGKVLANILETDHQNDSLLSLIGKGIQHTYQRRIEGAKRAKNSGSTMRQEMEKKSTEIIVPMVEAGIQLLAGSDCGPYNSYVYPGAALHGELRELVAAGLSPQQALQASILNGPAFFGLEDYYGTVDEGKVADLIILEMNPLEDIEFSDAIWMVIHKGKTYPTHK
ncbi:amidohydrolase [Marivirga lumbricoides]|uniref:Amidohydrolase n=1 Tax=Marivirga lumbricoides TaxID=1046115 RepID=A0ABQ1N5U0_9BACT|nr:amidohydrolase [Marivirga lumbricoides]